MSICIKKRKKLSSVYDSGLSKEVDRITNHDNTKCLAVLAAVILFCDFLNEINIFNVEPTVMRIGAASGALLYFTPVFLMLAYNHKNSGKDIANKNWFKYFIITFTWLGTFCVSVTLTHHAVIVMAIPILTMAQYRNTRELVPLTLLCGTICVLLGVYGGYFIGCFDANLLHLALTDTNAFDLKMRAEMATPQRMYELLTHYALAREVVVVSLVFLADKISKRSNAMLERQATLQAVVAKEMKKNSDIQWQIIDSMANLIENRDSSTGEHVKRTSYYVDLLSREFNKLGKLNDGEVSVIVKAAPLHDIGKIVVSDRILQKPGKLTPEERQEMQLHASEGKKVVRNVLGAVEDEKFLRVAEEIAGCHHERWDGNGYPDGLAGEKIPLSARIMAVADVYDALVSRRVYKEPISPEEAFEIIKSESGKQFDPSVIDVFVKLKSLFVESAENAI